MAAPPPPPFAWSVVESLHAEPLYAPEDMAALFVSLGPPDHAKAKAEAVAFKLSELGKTFAFDLWHEARPNSYQLETEAGKLATALAMALQVAGCSGGSEPTLDALPPYLGGGGLFAAAYLRGEPKGEAAVMNALRAVHLLRQDALKLVEIARKRQAMSGDPKLGRKKSGALPRLVAGLSAVYFGVWEALPAVSRSVDGPSGQFVRLMCDVAERLSKRGVRFGWTAESLAKQWERLEPGEKLRLPIDKKGIAGRI